MSDFESGHEEQGQSGVLSEEELREPRMYRVLLHNDDYTTMEFVILVLVDIFRKTAEEASEIMLAVHRNGMGVCGVYPREIAEFRVREVEKRARLAWAFRCAAQWRKKGDGPFPHAGACSGGNGHAPPPQRMPDS